VGRVPLTPVRTSAIDMKSIRFGTLDAFFDLAKEHDSRHEYSVAWVDCASRGAALGRGIFMTGDHAAHGALDIGKRRTRRRVRCSGERNDGLGARRGHGLVG